MRPKIFRPEPLFFTQLGDYARWRRFGRHSVWRIAGLRKRDLGESILPARLMGKRRSRLPTVSKDRLVRGVDSHRPSLLPFSGFLEAPMFGIVSSRAMDAQIPVFSIVRILSDVRVASPVGEGLLDLALGIRRLLVARRLSQ